MGSKRFSLRHITTPAIWWARAGGDNSVNDKITSIDLPSGADARDYIFVEVVGATISGYVFQDGPDVQLAFGEEQPDVSTVSDGRFTADDTPIAGVVFAVGR